MMPNVMAYLPILVGVLRAGMVLVNINPMYTASELHHQLEDAEVDAIFIFESFAATLAEVDPSVRPGKVVLVSVGDLLGLKGKVLDFAARHIKHMVPRHGLNDAIPFGEVVRKG